MLRHYSTLESMHMMQRLDMCIITDPIIKTEALYRSVRSKWSHLTPVSHSMYVWSLGNHSTCSICAFGLSCQMHKSAHSTHWTYHDFVFEAWLSERPSTWLYRGGSSNDGFRYACPTYQVWTTLMNMIAWQSRNLHITHPLSDSRQHGVDALPLTWTDFTSVSYNDEHVVEWLDKPVLKIFEHMCPIINHQWKALIQ